MMRRTAAVAAATTALLLIALPSAAGAAPAAEPLTKYVKDAAGGYGYSTQPVYTYPGSGEQVSIPTSLVEENRRFSSAWVGTIGNLNFGKPSNAADFDAKYSAVLDDFASWNMNAVIFQVRPLLDAYYPSDLNPWSEFLTGTQGADPGYDPLQRMVDATHARGMEFHAWLNPYRVTNTKMTAPATLAALGLTAAEVKALSIPEYIAALNAAGVLADDNFAVQHPDWVLSFDEKLFLDPGQPDVPAYVAASVAEIVENYDVDAIHFDDYFYPYRITVDGQNVFFGEQGEDRATFEDFGLTAGYPDTAAGVESWRRDNITGLITQVGDAVDAHNQSAGTAVQLGISPFGIWEHKALDPAGSNTPTGSSQSYSHAIFADTRGWVQDELIDYLVPQIYWSFDQAAAPYGELAQWWSDVAADSHTQVYVGHALYKHVNNGGFDPAWMNPEEVPNQIRFNQTLDGIDGSVLFSYNDMKPSALTALPADQQPKHQAKNTAIDLLKSEAFAYPTLVPAKPWLSDGSVAAPVSPTVSDGTLTWTAGDAQEARQYAIYRGTGTPAEIISAPGSLVDTVWAGGDATLRFTLPADTGSTARAGADTWVVTALDAAAVESAPVAATDAPVDPTDPTTPGTPTNPGTPVDPASPADPDDSSQSGGVAVRDDLASTGGAAPIPALIAAGALLTAGAVVAGAAAFRRRRLQ
ncbi:family 10 glycosylhydrolase [Microbacterium sp. SSW1-49]|uniref:Family 10 glycosylhydrolase n=1 Tax=Microbacterium croceum TaxID=2851645 RepID=A0ABT0FA09_9MICO|nr:family 10 glycosylhydrolase [Microbacterium croceum]MCK2034899.1 family 10 glycosylhydrolase [Microbacterium croceum]